MASASFQISSDGGTSYAAADTALADANALAYVASGTYSMKARLISTAGVASVAWDIVSADDVHYSSLPTVTSDATTKTCTFDVPKTGGAWLLRCRINSGVNESTGTTDASYTKTLAIKVLSSVGLQVIAVGETTEADATTGYTKAFNDLARTATSGGTLSISGQTTGDLIYYNGSAWVRLAIGANGTVLKSDGSVASWGSAAVSFPIPVFAANASTVLGSGSPYVLAEFWFDPAIWPTITTTSTITLHAVIETTSGSKAANLQLDRVSGTGAPATLATPSSSSTTSAHVSADVSTYFRSTAASGIFRLSLYISSADGTERATCTGAFLHVSP